VVGEMPHPNGMIKVEIQKVGTVGISADIELPANVPGTFTWKGKQLHLHAGKQHIQF